jgi:long-chain acyl-CoA synthetase
LINLLSMHLGAVTAKCPDKAAVILGGTGQVITYRELDAASNRLARALYAAGLRPGDHIAFMLENHPEYLAIAWAAQRSGLYYTAISSQFQPAELAYIVDNCEARVFISSRAVAGVADAITARTPRVELRLMLDGVAAGFRSYEDAVAGCPDTPLPREVEGGDMLYSAGTTGRPKGILAELPFGPMGTATMLYDMVRALYQADSETVYLSPAPLYHAAPLRFCLAMHRAGATVVVMERFDPVSALALIERYRVTHSQWVPTMFIRMLKLPFTERERHDTSSMRFAIHAAAPCAAEVKERMIDWWGPVLYEYYAGTEGVGFVCCDSAEWLAHKGTVGRSLLGPVHICDDEGRELPAGADGVVYHEGGRSFAYHGDPGKTAEALDPLGRGWATLGDVGHLDAEGYLYLTDRRSHLIISGGVNVYPQEAENVLALHPRVADVAVFGVPDAEMGEAVKAVVRPESMRDAGPGLERELIAYCRERLAHYKCPRSVDFRPELPRHPNGKLLKRLLKDEYARR